MSLQDGNYYYSGQGKVFSAVRTASGDPGPLRWFGNVTSLEVNIETDKLEHKDSYTGQRATDISILKEKKATFSLVVESFHPDNAAEGLWGTYATVAAGSGVALDDIAASVLDARYRLGGYVNLTSVTVMDVTDTTTYEFGASSTDVASKNGYYDAKVGSLHIFSDAEQTTRSATANIAVDDILHVSVDHGEYHRVDAFTKTSMERWLRFEGLNTLNEDKVVLDLYKASLDPLTGLNFFSEEVGSFTIAGSILYDSIKDVGGNSGFFDEKIITS